MHVLFHTNETTFTINKYLSQTYVINLFKPPLRGGMEENLNYKGNVLMCL